MVQLRPDDANLRLRIAEQMLRDGQARPALVHFKAAFQRDPSLLSGLTPIQIQRAWLNAGWSLEFFELLESIDFRELYPAAVTRTIDSLPPDPKLTDRIRALFRRAWDTFPRQRNLVVARIAREEIWQMPEMYDYAREAIIPKTRSAATYNPWSPFAPGIGVGNPPQPLKPPILMIVDLAASLGKLQELVEEIQTTRKRLPEWTAGEAILALVLARAGKYREAEAVVRKLPETIEKDTVVASAPGLFYVYCTIGVDLEQNPVTRDLAIGLYEHAITTQTAYYQWRFQPEQRPTHRLVRLYRRDRRHDNARRSLLKSVLGIHTSDNVTESQTNQFKMQMFDIVAKELIDLGFTADAVPLLNEALRLGEGTDPIASVPVLYRDLFQTPDQIRQHLTDAIERLSPLELAPLASRLIVETSEAQTMNKDASQPKSASKPRTPVIDLLLLIHPSELDQATVRSLLAESLTACDQGQLAAIDRPLDALRTGNPNDLSVAIVTALRTLAGEDSETN